MQHPVGYRINPVTNRAELTDFPAVLTNPTTLVTFPHTMMAAFLTAGAFMLAVSAWHMARRRDRDVFAPSLRLALWVVVVSGVLVAVTGDLQARIMTQQQPMKMAAAEALYQTSAPASFSLFTIGNLDGSRELWSLRVPGVLSFMATGSPSGQVEGINDLQSQYQQRYGAGDYAPSIPVTYWSFRFMIGLGALVALLGVVGLWLTRWSARAELSTGDDHRWLRWFWRVAPWAVGLPLAANSFGWIFTEMGRQPWTVFGVLKTANSASPSVAAGTVATSLVVFTVLYGVLAVVELYLTLRFARAGAPPTPPEQSDVDETERPLTFAY
jgi:cytochrome d ubiquinol oxidase subunit I